MLNGMLGEVIMCACRQATPESWFSECLPTLPLHGETNIPRFRNNSQEENPVDLFFQRTTRDFTTVWGYPIFWTLMSGLLMRVAPKSSIRPFSPAGSFHIYVHLFCVSEHGALFCEYFLGVSIFRWESHKKWNLFQKMVDLKCIPTTSMIDSIFQIFHNIYIWFNVYVCQQNVVFWMGI